MFIYNTVLVLPSHSIHKNVVNEEDGSQGSHHSYVILLTCQDNDNLQKHHNQDGGLHGCLCDHVISRISIIYNYCIIVTL